MIYINLKRPNGPTLYQHTDLSRAEQERRIYINVLTDWLEENVGKRSEEWGFETYGAYAASYIWILHEEDGLAFKLKFG